MAKTRITISIDRDMLERIKAAAESSGGSLSSEISRCIGHALGPAEGVVSFESLGRCAADLRQLADVLTGRATAHAPVTNWPTALEAMPGWQRVYPEPPPSGWAVLQHDSGLSVQVALLDMVCSEARAAAIGGVMRAAVRDGMTGHYGIRVGSVVLDAM